MARCNVDIACVGECARALGKMADTPVPFIDGRLLDKADDLQADAQRTIGKAEAQIALKEAEIVALSLALPEALAADALAMAAGEPANAAQEIELKIAACRAGIERLRGVISDINCKVIAESRVYAANYIESAERISLKYGSRFAEVLKALDEYIELMTEGKSELLSGGLEVGYGHGAPSMEANPQEAHDVGSIADDISAILYADGSTRNEIALLGDDYADAVATGTYARDIDALRCSGDAQASDHRHPTSFGSWLDQQGNPMDSSSNFNDGTFYWHPDSGHVFGGERNNPMGLTAGEVLGHYGFSCFTYKDGYPIFPDEAIMATVPLEGVLSAHRPKNFDEAADLLIATHGEGQKPEFRHLVSNFMLAYPDKGDWFDAKSQVKKFLKVHRLTWHESEDMRSILLIPREVHGMALHDGGVSNAKYRDRIESEFRLLAKAAYDELIAEGH